MQLVLSALAFLTFIFVIGGTIIMALWGVGAFIWLLLGDVIVHKLEILQMRRKGEDTDGEG